MEEAKRAGWCDKALYDAISVCALFNFYNRWIDASGVHDMAEEAYEMQAKKLAYQGYAPPEPPQPASDGRPSPPQQR